MCKKQPLHQSSPVIQSNPVIVYSHFKGISDHVVSDNTICNTTIAWWTYHDKVRSVGAKELTMWPRSIIPKPKILKVKILAHVGMDGIICSYFLNMLLKEN